MTIKHLIITFVILLLLIGGGFYYWFFFYNAPTPFVAPGSETPSPVAFKPIDRGGNTPVKNTPNSIATSTPTDQPTQVEVKIPLIRHLSLTPIGGYMSSSTISTTTVRYVDRGVGHIFEVLSTTEAITKISNTTIPRVYESYWNKNLTAAVFRYIKDETGAITNFYAEIRPVKVASSTTGETITSGETVTTPYEVKGKFISSNIQEMAASPKGDSIFTLNIENGRGVGYISGFDESKKTKILDTPLTQLNVDWPSDTTIALTTKGSGVASGYLYYLDTKKGVQTKILGNIIGLSTKVSSDAKKVLFSSGRSNKITTAVYSAKDSSVQNVIFNTLADKCVWSKVHPDEAYCAVPTEIPSGIYPDDWYKGNVSFVDQIWHLQTTTGQVKLVANLLNLANDLIDATNLTLDPRENFLYFTNKRDLTLWSLDISSL